MPSARLRRLQLIEIGRGGVLTLCPLKINERILHTLVGVEDLDERLRGIIEPLHDLTIAVDSHQQIASHLAQTWSMAKGKGDIPIIQLCGEHSQTKRAIES